MKTERLTRQKAEAIDREIKRLQQQVRVQREEMEEQETELLSKLQAREELRCMEEEKLQGMRKEIEKQHDQLKHLTELWGNNQCKELSEAFGFSEEQPSEVLDTFVAVEKGKVAITERRTLAVRQEQLMRYQVEARDQAGQLLQHENLLKDHINALKKQNEALEKR